MRVALFAGALLPLIAAGQNVVPVEPALAEVAATREYQQALVSPDGSRLAYVQKLGSDKSEIFSASLTAGATRPTRLSAGDSTYDEHGIAWSPDSKQIAFLSDREKKGQLQLYIVPATGGQARQLTHLRGLLDSPKWSPDGASLAFLFTENLPRKAGPVDAVLPDEGVVESKVYEQRLAIIDANGGAPHQISPPDFYIYEYDWAPDGHSFAATAARGVGDNNWWIAQLFTITRDSGKMSLAYKPGTQQQIAVPTWSQDGKSILFIGGLMSDEGSTGGEIFEVPATGGPARSLTPGLSASASDMVWPRASKQLYFSEDHDGGSAISKLDVATGQIERMWQAEESIKVDDSVLSLADDGRTAALVRSSWQHPPEVWAGPIGAWTQRTHANQDRKPLWGEAKSLHWKSNGVNVQGWLLYPKPFDPARSYPMVVSVHGGPASSLKPSWPRPGFNAVLLSQQGYFVFMPNPRGSYGQGEKFTLANVKDFGGGDLRDILAGVDEVIKTAPIDPQRVGITGWSYGGYMTMFAITQTNRFRAAVAGAGIANWESYYGENAIDQWMIPYFGASVYDNPAVYAKASPITFIKQVKTPTLVVVGAGDGECPAPQSYEFWHALKSLGVRTELVVYPNEGHHFRKPENQRDVLVRMIEWFNGNMK